MTLPRHGLGRHYYLLLLLQILTFRLEEHIWRMGNTLASLTIAAEEIYKLDHSAAALRALSGVNLESSDVILDKILYVVLSMYHTPVGP